jgi:hypothetical protein
VRDEERVLTLGVLWKAFRIMGHFFLFLPVTAGILCVNAVLLRFLERQIGWFDAVYATFITFFTVGYGDLVPSRVITKLSCLLVAGWGMLFMGIFTSAVLLAAKIEGQKAMEREPKLRKRWREVFEGDVPRIPGPPPRDGDALVSSERRKGGAPVEEEVSSTERTKAPVSSEGETVPPGRV